MPKIQELLSRHRRGTIEPFKRQLALFGLVFAVYFAYLLNYGDKTFWYDSGSYFDGVKSWSLDRYDMVIRGYAFPYVCFLIRQVAGWCNLDAHVLFWAISSVGAAWLGTVVVPGLVRFALAEGFPSTVSVLVFNGLLFYFFRGYASYPLADFPALTAFLTALWLIGTSYRGLFIGMALACAVNFRLVYAIIAMPVGLLLIYRALLAWKRRSLLYALRFGCTVALGLCIVLGPQGYINHHNFGRDSVMPPTDLVFGRSLYFEQISGGMGIQKYESNLGPDYPRASVSFRDPSGARLAIKQSVSTPSGFLRMFVQYPDKTVAVYARHLFNGVDVKYPTPYIQHLLQTSWLFSLLNYAVLFRCLAEVGSGRLWRFRADKFVVLGMLAAVLMVVAAVIPTAVEVRFFLPLHVLIYLVVAFGDLNWWLRPTLGRVILFGLFASVCFAMSDYTYLFI